MATLVKFRTYGNHPNNIDVYAVFPQLNYNKRIYGNNIKTGYSHLGQHTSVHIEYINESRQATKAEYLPLKEELESIGYKLKICK